MTQQPVTEQHRTQQPPNQATGRARTVTMAFAVLLLALLGLAAIVLLAA